VALQVDFTVCCPRPLPAGHREIAMKTIIVAAVAGAVAASGQDRCAALCALTRTRHPPPVTRPPAAATRSFAKWVSVHGKTYGTRAEYNLRK
jgi:hypothetical protein